MFIRWGEVQVWSCYKTLKQSHEWWLKHSPFWLGYLICSSFASKYTLFLAQRIFTSFSSEEISMGNSYKAKSVLSLSQNCLLVDLGPMSLNSHQGKWWSKTAPHYSMWVALEIKYNIRHFWEEKFFTRAFLGIFPNI